jgi:hypothetical protein
MGSSLKMKKPAKSILKVENLLRETGHDHSTNFTIFILKQQVQQISQCSSVTFNSNAQKHTNNERILQKKEGQVL